MTAALVTALVLAVAGVVAALPVLSWLSKRGLDATAALADARVELAEERQRRQANEDKLTVLAKEAAEARDRNAAQVAALEEELIDLEKFIEQFEDPGRPDPGRIRLVEGLRRVVSKAAPRQGHARPDAVRIDTAARPPRIPPIPGEG